jgi:4-azaleucine resistance transporter AzlC
MAALRDSSSVGLGFIPLGIAFGVFLTHAGLPWWCASLFATIVYAGSFEFLLVGLVTAAAPLAAIALTAFLVNARHVFYALSFPLHRVQGRLARTYSTFALVDEAYALTTARQARSWPSRRIVWLQAFLHSYWASSATAGALLGSLIPGRVAGLDFAMTALFTVLALDAIRDRRGDLPTPGLALLAAVAARLAFPGQMLLAAFALFTATLLARRLAAGKGPSHA